MATEVACTDLREKNVNLYRKNHLPQNLQYDQRTDSKRILYERRILDF